MTYQKLLETEVLLLQQALFHMENKATSAHTTKADVAARCGNVYRESLERMRQAELMAKKERTRDV